MYYLPQAVEDVLGDVPIFLNFLRKSDVTQILVNGLPADVLKPVLGLGEAQTPAIFRP
jgi:hypothetical protein